MLLMSVVKSNKLYNAICYTIYLLITSEKQRKITMLTKSSIFHTIGNTPLLKLNKIVAPNSADVFVKLEYFNPTGSYKDRMALAMIEEAEKRGDLKPGTTVVEATGGSTGSSLAFICAVKGYPFTAVSADAFAAEKLNTMRAFGANLILVPSENKQLNESLFKRMMQTAHEIAVSEDGYWTDQLNNSDSIQGYKNIGREIFKQTDGKIDVFCGAVGTAGMLMGVSQALREVGSSARIVVLEPASSPIISQGKSGSHRVEGIGIGFMPSLLDQNYYDEARGIEEEEGREIARRMAKEEGIFAGISSGLNVAGALQLAQELGKGHTVVTVAVDTGLKYLSGDLYID
jgi:cysteine synthase